jgi:putative transposase
MSANAVPERPGEIDALHSASDKDWAEAVRRAAIIRPLAEAQRCSKAAVQAAAKSLGLSIPRTYRLVQNFRSRPLTASLLPLKRGRVKGSRQLDPQVEAQIDAAVDAIYLKPERPTVKRLFSEVHRTCVAAGIKPPSMKALRARVSARSLRERTKAREGAAIAADRFRQVKPGLRTERPLQVVQIDHTKVDIMLVDDVTRACIGRPWLTLVLDVHTRMVAGLTLSLDPPSAAGTALALTQAVLPKGEWLADRAINLAWPAFGLPEIIHVDNGAEFHARAFERGCQQYGIRIDYRPPATPRFGGHIERLMGTLMGRVHALPGTTFSDVAARGDYASEARAILTFREFERILAMEVLGPYHNEVHQGLGRAPAAAWAEGVSGMTLRSPVSPNGLLLDFLPFEERVIRRDGVRLFNVLYQDGALAHIVNAGVGKLRVKYDPRDLSAVFVELPGGDHVRVPYADLGRPAVTLWEHRLASKRLHEEGRRTVDEHAIFEAIEKQRRVLAQAYDRSKVARRSLARTPGKQDVPASHQPPQPTATSDDSDAKVPVITADDIAKTEFWS